MPEIVETTTAEPLPVGGVRFPRRAWRRAVLVGALLVVVALGGWGAVAAYSSLFASESTPTRDHDMPSETPVPVGPVAPSVVGKWAITQGIRREIDMRPDGTATMDVKLDFLASLLYGRELHMQLEWQQDGDRLTHTIVSGEPRSNVDRLIRDFGGTRTYRILELTDRELVLKDTDPSDPEEYRWQRGK